MPALKLTDLTIRSLKPTSGRQIDYWHGDGFGLRVSKGGTKTFVLKKANRRYSIGTYPDMSLQEARKRAQKLAATTNPHSTTKPTVELPEALETYYSTHCASLRPGTVKETKRLLKKLPRLDLSTQDIYRLIDGIAGPSEKLHTFAAWKGFYIWATRRQYLDRSPMEGMKPPAQNAARDRLLTDAEIRIIWNGANNLVRLLICTGQRFNQIASLDSAWISEGSIHYPAKVMKNKLPHTLPIGDFTKRHLPLRTGLLFPSGDDPTAPMPNKGKQRYVKDCPVKDWVMHDIRRYYASTLASLGVPIATCEMLLSHVNGSLKGIVRIYQRYNFEKEKREAQLLYEKHLETILACAKLPAS